MVKPKSPRKTARPPSATTSKTRRAKLAKGKIAARAKKADDVSPKGSRKTVNLDSKSATIRRVNKQSTSAKHGSASYIHQTPGLKIVEVSDGIAVHDSEFTTVHYLNHTAAAIFLLCGDPITPEKIWTVMKEEFDLNAGQQAEIKQAIADMKAAGIIQEVQPATKRAGNDVAK